MCLWVTWGYQVDMCLVHSWFVSCSRRIMMGTYVRNSFKLTLTRMCLRLPFFLVFFVCPKSIFFSSSLSHHVWFLVLSWSKHLDEFWSQQGKKGYVNKYCRTQRERGLITNTSPLGLLLSHLLHYLIRHSARI